MITDNYKRVSLDTDIPEPSGDIAGYDSEGNPVHWSDIYNPDMVRHYLEHPELEVKGP